MIDWNTLEKYMNTVVPHDKVTSNLIKLTVHGGWQFVMTGRQMLMWTENGNDHDTGMKGDCSLGCGCWEEDHHYYLVSQKKQPIPIRPHMVVIICSPLPYFEHKMSFFLCLKATLISLLECPCRAIYKNLAGQLVINWHPNALAHSGATTTPLLQKASSEWAAARRRQFITNWPAKI